MTHAELSSGYQVAQVAHAVAEFAIQEPDLFKRWHEESNYVVVLEAGDEGTLEEIRNKATIENLDFTDFREPDIGNSLTAIAFHPTKPARKLLSSLPLVGRGDPRQQNINSRKNASRLVQ